MAAGMTVAMLKTVFAPNPLIPFTLRIPGMMSPGKKLFIQGCVDPNAMCFFVHLTCEEMQEPPFCDDIALNFSPSLGQGVEVCNNSKNKTWDKVKVPNVLQRGQKFEITICAEATQYKIALDGQPLPACMDDINHLHRNERISLISMDGNVRIYHIRLEDGTSSAAPVPSV